MKFLKRHGGLLATLLMQMLLVGLAFWPHISEPSAYVLDNRYDAIKNLFNFQYYVEHSGKTGWLAYRGMNHPFTESIFFTDNCPLLAIPIRALVEWGWLAPENAIGLHNLLLLSSFLVSAWLIYLLVERLRMHWWIGLIAGVFLPWLAPQTFQVFGPPSLMLFVFQVAAIYLVLRWYEGVKENPNGKEQLWWASTLGLTIIMGALAHLYYLPLLLIPMSVVMGWPSLLALRERNFKPVLGSLIALAFPAILIFTLTRISDPYPGQRPTPDGFDLGPWKAVVGDYFTGYEFSDWIPPFFTHDTWGEGFVYLGAGCVYLGILIGFFHLVYRLRPGMAGLEEPSSSVSRGFIWLLFIAGLLTFFISLGIIISMPRIGFKMDNIFSPVYWAVKVSDFVKQFRALVRFGWFFFWPANFLVLFLWNDWLNRQRKLWARMVVAILGSALFVIDGLAIFHFYQGVQAKKNIFRSESLAELPEIHPEAYQAILPLPYFNKGNEQKGFVLDDDPVTSAHAFQWSIKTGLPLAACKLDRTPFYQTKLQYSMLVKPNPSDSLLKLINTQPYFVLYKKSFPKNDLPAGSVARIVLEAGRRFPKRKNLELLFENEQFAYYRWEIIQEE